MNRADRSDLLSGSQNTRGRCAGGGANNPIFTRIRAMALGIEASISAMTEAAIGSAKLARPC
jgi:sugar (pentulose or hexulose) kinase